MYLNIQGEAYEVTADNSYYFVGDTLIHGLYVDMDDDYFFLPTEAVKEDDVEDLLDSLSREGVHVIDLEYYDPEADPFCFIINALCRYFAREIDGVCDGED